jgi:hypothetical protein
MGQLPQPHSLKGEEAHLNLWQSEMVPTNHPPSPFPFSIFVFQSSAKQKEKWDNNGYDRAAINLAQLVLSYEGLFGLPVSKLFNNVLGRQKIRMSKSAN